jgi:hypothetical protein
MMNYGWNRNVLPSDTSSNVFPPPPEEVLENYPRDHFDSRYEDSYREQSDFDDDDEDEDDSVSTYAQNIPYPDYPLEAGQPSTSYGYAGHQTALPHVRGLEGDASSLSSSHYR